MFFLAVAVFRCSIMTVVNTAYELYRVLMFEGKQSTVDGYQLLAFKLTTMTISDYIVLIIFNEHGGGIHLASG